MTAVKLDKLLDNLGLGAAAGEGVEITGVTTDPDLCRPGFLYVAEISESVDSKRLGVRLDGRDFIDRAVTNGAVAVLTTPDVVLPEVRSAAVESARQVLLVKHDRPLTLLGALCAKFYGQPRPQHIALVTGTNGKTSTVNFCRMLWSGAHLPACSIGNLGGVCSDGTLVWDRHPTLSVPDTVTLHKILHDVAGRGFDYVAMEATSHALFDQRVTGLGATIGAFTNITRDHLDFHGDMEEYFRVKMTLFSEVLAPGSVAVLNADADAGAEDFVADGVKNSNRYSQALAICHERGHKVISYGFNGDDVRLVDCEDVENGQNLILEIFGKKYNCHVNLSGLFQVSNVLCALSIVLGSGVPVERLLPLLPTLTEIEGRLNTVAFTPSGGRVIVDYAHSAHALRAALEAARSLTVGKLVVVFGCGGERDPGKRSEMGRVAAIIADQVIVTDDNPRCEDPAEIRRAVMVGAPRALEVDNRVKAIEMAMRSLAKGDCLLIAGKGHETTQTIGEESFPYSDIETARHLAAELEQATYVKRNH
ncbi:MAG: UDP-N-acetylmuramoyl-L-alanyl-D-glutamate--2,6-diaminopimelate ligase [Cyanobacteria bacterium REEB67]|nr:UDP-N-acetylmuramoyl-L-alanyl-D-glutamate--2,6-diaminopimelate ligase [Cyanobacteria bacterium REEB67]